MDIKSILAYKLKNTSTETICDIAPGDSKVVILNPHYFSQFSSDALYFPIRNKVLEVYDISNVLVDNNIAASVVSNLVSKSTSLVSDVSLMSNLSPEYASSLKVSWNINAAHLIISMVRSQMISYGVTSHGVSPILLLTKLSQVIAMITIGMFSEAAVILNSVQNDDFLSKDRVDLFVSILTSADALSE